MTKDTKDNIAVISACVMLVFGLTLTAIGFALDPTGEVHDSVLWILGQCLIYAGSIFGIAYYTKGQINKQLDERFKNSDKEAQNNETEA